VDNDDIEALRREILGALGPFGDVYPSMKGRLNQLVDSDDPYVRQLMADLIAAGKRQHQSEQSRFADRFGLTYREAQIVDHLVAGGSVADYAARQGLSEQTVRSQLKSIFAKTGVSRQAALIGLAIGRRKPE
jgi:DNA-binding CsgD family transcriptional regulator